MKLFHSFHYAFKGIHYGLKEMNLKIHILAAVLVLIIGISLSISATQWAILLLCIGAVIGSELMNSAVEKTCDVIRAISPDSYDKLGIPKDLAAAGVFVLSIVALCVGVITLEPSFLHALGLLK